MQRKDLLIIIGLSAIVLLVAAGGLGVLFWQHARAGGFALGPETIRDAAWAHWGLGDYDAALAEFDRAVQADRRELHSFFGRGVTHLLLGQLDEAVSDLQEAAILGTGESDYPRLYLWIARARLAGGDEADVELRAAVDGKRFMFAWALTIARFLLDEVSEEAFLNEAQLPLLDMTTTEKNCEALYYAAAKRAVADDEDGAVTLFRACVATGVRNYYEYHSALAELRQRGLAPSTVPTAQQSGSDQ